MINKNRDLPIFVTGAISRYKTIHKTPKNPLIILDNDYMTKEDLIVLVQQIIDVNGKKESDIDLLIDEFRRNVPHPSASAIHLCS